MQEKTTMGDQLYIYNESKCEKMLVKQSYYLVVPRDADLIEKNPS